MKHGFLGWDVGAWHCDKNKSRDALVLVSEGTSGLEVVGHAWRGNLRYAYNRANGGGLLNELLGLAGSRLDDWSTLTIAIDTPLTWPQAFESLLAGKAPDTIPATKGANPMLLRLTERWLWERGHEPLSAVQDMIGSQATKGIAFLARLGVQSVDIGVWAGLIGATAVTAIEAYPSPAKRSGVMGTARSEVGSDLAIANDDVDDALTCALIAWMYSKRRELLAPPPPSTPHGEGWIWVPRDCLTTPGATR
jgi:hypothetical protein